MTKRIFIPLLFLLATVATVHAQKVRFGVKVGAQTETQQFKDIQVNQSDSLSLTLGLSDRKMGFHGGIWARFGDKVFLQPELVLNTNSTEYKVGSLSLGDVVKKESYMNLDLPVMVGAGIGPLRVYGGPVGHIHLSSHSQLTDISGYSQTFKGMNWGWQAGLGVGRGRFSFDLRYEGNSSKNDHYTFFGQQYQASNAPSRLFASVQVSLNN